MTSIAEADFLDSLLTLEDEFYKDGYDLGLSDGSRVGLIEGRFFGLEKGFEKYASMGRLYGRAVIWTGRLPLARDSTESAASAADIERDLERLSVRHQTRGIIQSEVEKLSGQFKLPGLPANTRLEKHLRTLYALTEPESLSTANDEKSVSAFDDRYSRAEGKAKVVENFTGDTVAQEDLVRSLFNSSGSGPKDVRVKRGEGGIEDFSSLQARH